MSRTRPTPPSRADVLDAAQRINGYVRGTTLLDSPSLGAGGVLAVECFQPTGSFKVRGALAALAPLGPGEHVVTASAGNHALAIAHAARVLEVGATVVVPENASPAKLEALEALEAKVVLKGQRYDDAEKHALKLAQKAGRFVSAYNDRFVIAGQGTVAMELLKRIEGPMTVVVPIGGGGLAAGVALWATQRAGVNVVGVEVEACRAVSTAIAKGKIVKVPLGESLADGLVGNLEEGTITVDLIQRYVERIVAVGEDEVLDAMRFLASRHGLVVEGGGAVATAAILAGKVEAGPGRIVSLVTGRNVAPDALIAALKPPRRRPARKPA